MFRTHRAIYNKLVEVSKQDLPACFTSTTSKEYNFLKTQINKNYRPITQKQTIGNYLPKFHSQTPEEVMDSTFRDFMKAIESSRALYVSLKEKDQNTSCPSMKFKSWKDNSSSIEIRSRSFKGSKDGVIRFFPTFLGKQGIKFNGLLPNISSSVRLIRTRNQKYYLAIPQLLAFDQTPSKRICAIDPGVRDFITLYDPNGFTLGIKDGNDIVFKKCLEIDRLQSKLSKIPKGKEYKRLRYRTRKKIYYLYQNIKNMIKDMHQKVSRWISDNYKEVLLPKFETSQMTSKQKRLHSKTSRKMLTWSHYKFREMLTYKMNRSGGHVILCTEYFTSKTCSNCGKKNNNIQGQKEFNCLACLQVIDRDVNAARNIFMMNEGLLTWTTLVQALEKPTLRCRTFLERVLNQTKV